MENLVESDGHCRRGISFLYRETLGGVEGVSTIEWLQFSEWMLNRSGQNGEVKNGNVQTPTRLRFGSAERMGASLHDRGDAALVGQVRHIILLAACRANRDHPSREREESCGIGSGFPFTQCALCEQEVLHKP